MNEPSLPPREPDSSSLEASLGTGEWGRCPGCRWGGGERGMKGDRKALTGVWPVMGGLSFRVFFRSVWIKEFWRRKR